MAIVKRFQGGLVQSFYSSTLISEMRKIILEY